MIQLLLIYQATQSLAKAQVFFDKQKENLINIKAIYPMLGEKELSEKNGWFYIGEIIDGFLYYKQIKSS